MVKLEPQNWCASNLFRFSSLRTQPNLRAWLAKKKAAPGPKCETMETLTHKISRLQKVNLILKAMIAVRHVFEVVYRQWHDSLPSQNPPLVVPPVNPTPTPGPDPALGDDLAKRFLEAQQKYQDASAK